jgi:hypothetical protein
LTSATTFSGAEDDTSAGVTWNALVGGINAAAAADPSDAPSSAAARAISAPGTAPFAATALRARYDAASSFARGGGGHGAGSTAFDARFPSNADARSTCARASSAVFLAPSRSDADSIASFSFSNASICDVSLMRSSSRARIASRSEIFNASVSSFAARSASLAAPASA